MLGLWQYRRFVWDTAIADLRYRYAGSGLGVFWNVLTPLAMLALYTFIFTAVLGPRVPSATSTAGAFVLYLASGFLPWGVFAEGVIGPRTVLWPTRRICAKCLFRNRSL